MTKMSRKEFYEGTDKDGRFWRYPRIVDPEADGTRLATHHPILFDLSTPEDSLSLKDFDRLVESTVPNNVISRIEAVIDAGTFLATLGLADTPPLDLSGWRRGMILSWLHARDLVVVHDALGHPRSVGSHDMDEVVLGRHLKDRLTDQADQWYTDYVNSLDEGARVNVGFFNPHISASLFKWGDAKGGVQNAMDAHRLAAHHQGSPETPLDWIERAVNFVVHHIPREHWGIRHEPRGEWGELEVRMLEDPAIKDATIGKVIARDAAVLFELLEREGKVVPWQLLDVPDDDMPPSVIEHARLVLKAAQQLNAGPGNTPLSDQTWNDDEALSPARIARAISVMERLPQAITRAKEQGTVELAQTYAEWLREYERS